MKCSFHSVQSTLLDFRSSRLSHPHFIPTLSFILYKVTNDLNRTRLSYGTRHRTAKIRVSYLQDVELDYSVSIFVKGIECSCKRQQIMELGNFSTTQSFKKYINSFSKIIRFSKVNLISLYHHNNVLNLSNRLIISPMQVFLAPDVCGLYLLNMPSSLTKQQM